MSLSYIRKGPKECPIVKVIEVTEATLGMVTHNTQMWRGLVYPRHAVCLPRDKFEILGKTSLSAQ